MFVNNMLGLRVDVPASQVSLRPFCPWPEFTWEDCRLGRAVFDFAHDHRDGSITGQITSRNDNEFKGVIELTLPEDAAAKVCKVNGVETEEVEHTERYGRPAVRVAGPIAPGATLRLEVPYAK
jgi:hypothetical protein